VPQNKLTTAFEAVLPVLGDLSKGHPPSPSHCAGLLSGLVSDAHFQDGSQLRFVKLASKASGNVTHILVTGVPNSATTLAVVILPNVLTVKHEKSGWLITQLGR
jgi:hypothetical protein